MRAIVFILFIAVLCAPVVLRFVSHGDNAEVAAGGERLVIVTPNNQDICRTFAAVFEKWHREKYDSAVRLEFRVPGGTNDIRRLLETTYNAVKVNGKLPPEEKLNTGLDVLWGGGDYFFDQEIKPLGFLKPVGIRADVLHEAFPSAELAGVRLYDKSANPLWVGVCLSSFGIVYNPDVYRSLGLRSPQRWEDLTDERLANWLALADPTHSGSAGVAYMIVVQRAMADAEGEFLKDHAKTDPGYSDVIELGWKDGMRKLVLIAANARHWVDSAPLVPNEVGNGDCAAGMAIDFYGRIYQQTVGSDRCRVVMPAGATAITPDPVGILYGTTGRRYELAKHFVEFLLSREGQRLWNVVLADGRSLRRLPIRQDVYGDRSGWVDQDVNPFVDAHGFNQRAEWMVLFTDTLPIWAAAWIDSREALQSAYAEILAVKDENRRRELIAELSDLPIEMSDVANMRAERRKLEASGSSQLWKAQKRMEWAQKFRGHYLAVGAKAKSLAVSR